MPINFETFKPTSVDELRNGLLQVVIDTAAGQWNLIRNEMTYQLSFIAEKTATVMAQLSKKQITRKEADGSLHLLEINLNSALREFAFMAYTVAQKILNSVFQLLRSAIRNVTGITLLL
ncbi:hypothetical protein [Rhizobium sp. BK251]|uniref:hypothetical protein n=1 Tax=Rhizobium sp. BK251 TaxID=2512125 RepID=UPI00104CCF7D|nr:hypothetical protein [Rhizobium sp. BK251]TCL73923.1 hypothetical protein EV286_103457 [Rhizobium sp. BK251]